MTKISPPPEYSRVFLHAPAAVPIQCTLPSHALELHSNPGSRRGGNKSAPTRCSPCSRAASHPPNQDAVAAALCMYMCKYSIYIRIDYGKALGCCYRCMCVNVCRPPGAALVLYIPCKLVYCRQRWHALFRRVLRARRRRRAFK